MGNKQSQLAMQQSDSCDKMLLVLLGLKGELRNYIKQKYIGANNLSMGIKRGTQISARSTTSCYNEILQLSTVPNMVILFCDIHLNTALQI